MKRETRLGTTFGLAALLAASAISNVAIAQPPSGAPSGAPTSTTTAPAPGSVTNTSQTTTTESTTTVPSDMVVSETTSYSDEPLANTGGEPWMFVLGGLALASSALLLRRRVSNSA